MESLENSEKKNLSLLPIAPTGASTQSRAAAKAKEQEQKKAAEQQRLLFIMLAAVIALNLVLAYFFYGILVIDKTEDARQEIIQHEFGQANKLAFETLNAPIARLQEAAKNEAVIQAIKNKDKNAYSVLINTYLPQFNNAIDLKIFALGEADIDLTSAAPIRFSELDLIRRAEKDEKSFPEAARINEQLHIHFVYPVKEASDKAPIGVLYLTVNGEQLEKKWRASENAMGEKVLQQRFAKTLPYALCKVGKGLPALEKTQPIPNSNWEVKFTPSEKLNERAEESPVIWLVVMAIALSVSLFSAIILSRKITLQKSKKEQSLPPTMAEVNKTTTNSITEASPTSVYQVQDLLNIELADDDQNILGLNDTSNKKQVAELTSEEESKIPANIFRSYDIRGVIGKDLDIELAEKIGQAIGSEAIDQGEHSLLVARDARTHSGDLTAALINGILSTGCNVVNIGIAPTPLLYFATFYFSDVRSGVMVTASHNPAEYNGFKVVIKNNALADSAVTDLRTRILTKRLHQGLGEESFRDIIPHYIERIFSDVALAGDISIVVDAGNAVTGIVAPQLFEELGCQVTPLFCELDGNFPNHDPDPTIEKNLIALIAKVKEVNADLGVAFDGDGDRLVVVSPKGDIIWPDRLLMLFAKDVLSRHPGADVLFDVKCSRQLNQVISGYGGRPIMWKTGHSPMKAKMVETGALIGGEYSGHIFIKDRWYGFDDGIYAMARLLEIITLRDQNIDEIFAAFTQLITTPELKISVTDKRKFEIVQQLMEQGDFQNGNITTIDGVRVDYSKGWGLVRASNTSPALTLRFEAETDDALNLIQQIFKRELLKIDSSLEFTF